MGAPHQSGPLIFPAEVLLASLLSTVDSVRSLTFPHFSTILSNPTPPANPFPPPTCTPLCQIAHAHSNNNIVILDGQYPLCHSTLVFAPGGERSASLCPPPLYLHSLRRTASWALRVSVNSAISAPSV